MKIRIGNRLLQARETKDYNQTEMSNFLGISQSAYSRIERNEVGVDIEEVANFSKKLQIPIQEFLPETTSIHSTSQGNQNGQGLVLGNIYNYNYADKDETTKQLQADLDKAQQEVSFLKEKISNLEEIILLLKEKSK
jgi:transcriptional regulator with XRE-family HTH domain